MSLYALGLHGALYPLGLNPGAVALLLLRCIPCVHIVGLYPVLTLQSTTPALSLEQALPTVSVVSLAPALAMVATLAGVEVVSLVPALSVEGCDC